MVGRIRLIFWQLAARVHDRLHEIMDRRNLEFWTAQDTATGMVEPFLSADTTVTYYSED